MKHRTDIDGLRALAIIPVLLFHYDYKQIAPGGFIGVDIFFVISGFLITRNIHDDMRAGTYSVLNFYSRRVRRIFPALFVMFFGCLAGSLLFQFPQEAKTTGNSILASTFFVSNILFQQSTGYFDTKSLYNPLLHTWSLSVEEQFYVLLPCCLFLIGALSDQARKAAFWLAFIASLLAACLIVGHDRNAAFYLVQYRAWELLTGSLLAIEAVPPLKSRLLAECLGLAGLACILGAILLLTDKSLFPGPGAIAPCLGAALILYSGANGQTFTGRILSLYPLRFVGFISYSLYLWHWPVLVFYRGFHEPHQLPKLGLVVLSFALATLSWRFVERPFRAKNFPLRAPATVRAAGAVMAAAAALALIFPPLNQLVWRYPPQVTAMLAYLNYHAAGMRAGTCFVAGSMGDVPLQPAKCLTLDPTRKNYLLIGDSHAAHLWSGLQAAYPNINFLQATAAGCKPIIGAPGLADCRKVRDDILTNFIPHHHLDAIILSARWNEDEIAGALKTAKTLQPYANQVIIFGPSAEYDQFLPRLIARTMLHPNPTLIASHKLPAQGPTDQEFAKRAAAAGIPYVSVYTAMCPNNQCITELPGAVPLQFDGQHFTDPASLYIAQRLRFPPIEAVAAD